MNRILYSLVVVALTLTGLPGRAQAPTLPYSDTVFRIARHCINEMTNPRQYTECPALATVILRQAADRGVSVPVFYRSHYLRHQRGSRTRPWIMELNLQNTQPPSWCQNVREGRRCRPYAEDFASVWLHTLELVNDVVDGRRGHGCDGTPVVWGSPRYDRNNLDAWYARGYRKLQCGSGPNANEIVGR